MFSFLQEGQLIPVTFPVKRGAQLYSIGQEFSLHGTRKRLFHSSYDICLPKSELLVALIQAVNCSVQTLSQSSTASLQQHLERQRRRLRMGSSGSSLDTPSAESQAESPEPSISPAVYDCFESSTWDSVRRLWTLTLINMRNIIPHLQCLMFKQSEICMSHSGSLLLFAFVYAFVQ